MSVNQIDINAVNRRTRFKGKKPDMIIIDECSHVSAAEFDRLGKILDKAKKNESSN